MPEQVRLQVRLFQVLRRKELSRAHEKMEQEQEQEQGRQEDQQLGQGGEQGGVPTLMA